MPALGELVSAVYEVEVTALEQLARLGARPRVDQHVVDADLAPGLPSVDGQTDGHEPPAAPLLRPCSGSSLIRSLSSQRPRASP